MNGTPIKLACTIAFCVASLPGVCAADRLYFVTYDHSLEEPGDLEIAFNPLVATTRSARQFASSWMEIEYGVKGWWTTEFYLDGQWTRGEGALFTGYRWENRFRPLMREHRLNPVLYVEFEDVNGADKTIREVVGHDGESDRAAPNAELRAEHEREIETKLILSSNIHGWNISENLIAVKNLSIEPWEFGYAVGASRPLSMRASPRACRLCSENFRVGIELYGGLGEWNNFGLSGTSHYLAPTLGWDFTDRLSLRLSPTWGLTQNSYPFLLRFGVSYEVTGFGSRLRQLLR